MVDESERPPLYPLHRIMVVLRHLRRSTWLIHLRNHHPQPTCRQHVERLFRHIDQLQEYIRRHRILPSAVPSRRDHRQQQQQQEMSVLNLHHRYMELRQGHQHQLRESLNRIRQCTRPLRQYLLYHQADQLTRFHQCLNILDVFTTQL